MMYFLSYFPNYLTLVEINFDGYIFSNFKSLALLEFFNFTIPAVAVAAIDYPIALSI